MTKMNTQAGPGEGESRLKQEVGLIPGWAYILAAVVFVCIPVVFFGFVWPREVDQPQKFMRTVMPFLPATFLAFLVLMIGYVNRDAGRRGMNRTTWTLIVTFVPNAIGFIIYFLMRTPIQINCPNCRTVVDPRSNYCPNCQYSFHPTCAQCKSAVRTSDLFCTNCGVELKASSPGM